MTTINAVIKGRGDASSKKTVRCASEPDTYANGIRVQGGNGQRRQPTPRPRVCDPLPPCQCSWPEIIMRNIQELYCLWKRFCRDPFRWQILKSTLWFALALTIFNEMRGKCDDPTDSIEF